MKEMLSSQAGEATVQLSYNWQMEEQTVKEILKKVEEEYNRFKEVERKYKLIGAIEEISQLESEDVPISEAYRNILYNREEISKEYKRLPKEVVVYEWIVKMLQQSYMSLKNVRTSADKEQALQHQLNKIKTSYEHKFNADVFFNLILN